MARRLLVPLAAAALVLGVAGCGDGEPEPRKTDLIDLGSSDGGGEQPSDGGGEPSDGGGDESVNAAPDIPAPDPADFPGMDENTEQGAMQALRFYIAMVYWAHQTGDIGDLDSLADEGCVECAEFEMHVSDLAAKAQLWEGLEIRDIELVSYESESYDAEIVYGFVLGEHVEYGDADGVREVAPEVSMLSSAVMAWENDAWTILGLHVTEDDDAGT